MAIRWLKQLSAITAANLRALGERKASSAVAVVGIAGVVAILVGVLSMREGVRLALDRSGANNVAVITSRGADTESSSQLTREQVQIIADTHGAALTSAELYIVVNVPLRTTHTRAFVPLRGVGPEAQHLRSHFKLAQGRMFQSGRFELIVGRGAAAHLAGLELGRRVRLGKIDWEVVGIFDDAGSVSESEVWADAGVLQNAYQRHNLFQSVRVRLTTAEALREFSDGLSKDPRLSVDVVNESAYYASQSRGIGNMVTRFGRMVAMLMGIGAVFAALNTMYSAVSARTREIATLRALGFGAGPVVASVIGESLLLGLIGGLAGGAIAYLGFNGIQASTLNFRSFSQLAFAFAVTPLLLLKGIGFALALSFVGGLMPGIKAARRPVVRGLREL